LEVFESSKISKNTFRAEKFIKVGRMLRVVGAGIDFVNQNLRRFSPIFVAKKLAFFLNIFEQNRFEQKNATF
jgi:hypothetical protein